MNCSCQQDRSRSEAAVSRVRAMFERVAASRFPRTEYGAFALLLLVRVAVEQDELDPNRTEFHYDLAAECGIPMQDFPGVRSLAIRSGLLRYVEQDSHRGRYAVVLP